MPLYFISRRVIQLVVAALCVCCVCMCMCNKLLHCQGDWLIWNPELLFIPVDSSVEGERCPMDQTLSVLENLH